MGSNPVEDFEREIDKEFANNPLNEIPYSQAVWTILSVIEDKFLNFTNINPLPAEQQHVHVDVYMNALTHPLRSLFVSNNDQSSSLIKNEVINEHYSWAIDWLNNAEAYDNFCSIYPLWWSGKLKLSVEGEVLNTTDYKNKKIEYEAYNQLTRKGGTTQDRVIDPNELVSELESHVSVSGSRFTFNLDPKLAKILIEKYSIRANSQYDLPKEWQCKRFTFGEFKEVFVAIQALLYGRFIARAMQAKGMKGCGYADAVWLADMPELVSRLSRYTSVRAKIVKSILNYLTFGGAGVRNPDIAIQPILDLKNGYFALSPFVFLNSNPERNLCVLLNQIDDEETAYSKLTLEKEDVLRESLLSDIRSLGYEVAWGNLQDTDLDLAIIDRREKVCVSIELKWFIEPAEIREVINRSIELEKGVSQSLKILEKFKNNDKRLVAEVLKIDKDYEFAVAVGSMNWIGHFDVQSQEVPIIKIRHFIQELKLRKSLKSTVDWLMKREYLPKDSVDYEVLDMPLELGKWKSSWYGIKPLK